MSKKITAQECVTFDADGTPYGPADYDQLSERNKLIIFHMRALIRTRRQNNPIAPLPIAGLLEMAKGLADWMLKMRPQ